MGPEFLVVVGLLGCGGTPMDRQIPINRGRSYTQTVDTLGVQSEVPASAEKTWEVLAAVYTDLGLEINFREPEAVRLGSCFQKGALSIGERAVVDLCRLR